MIQVCFLNELDRAAMGAMTRKARVKNQSTNTTEVHRPHWSSIYRPELSYGKSFLHLAVHLPAR